MTARAIVLIGPMGAGKTSVGRRVARALELPFADTDKLVERSQRFFHRRVVVLPVELEEVDVVSAEALQRFVDGVE